jgi:hypothetical protein
MEEIVKFTISEDQQKKYKEWRSKIPTQYFGAIGGGEEWTFIPTGIGTIVKVKYGKHSIDLTDSENW